MFDEEELQQCECGGAFQEMNIRGRKFPFGQIKKVPLEIDLVVPCCNKCGDMMLSGAHTGVIDDALKETCDKQIKKNLEPA